MAKLGMKIGPERMYHWVHEFGLGGRTGIELPGENTGMMLPRERWDVINSSVSVSIGHEMSVTPLQMAAAHAAVANRGVWLTPRVVSRLRVYDESNGRDRDVPVGVERKSRRILSEQDALAIQRRHGRGDERGDWSPYSARWLVFRWKNRYHAKTHPRQRSPAIFQ